MGSTDAVEVGKTQIRLQWGTIVAMIGSLFGLGWWFAGMFSEIRQEFNNDRNRLNIIEIWKEETSRDRFKVQDGAILSMRISQNEKDIANIQEQYKILADINKDTAWNRSKLNKILTSLNLPND